MNKIVKFSANIMVLVFLTITLLAIFSLIAVPGDYKLYMVLSGSMAPALPIGSIVVVKPQADYNVGDIVTRPITAETTLTHRIVEKRDGNGVPAFRLKGDANEHADTGELIARQLVGKVVWHAPYVGYLVNATKTPVGFLSLIVIPALFIIVEEVLSLMNELKRKRKEKEEKSPMKNITNIRFV